MSIEWFSGEGSWYCFDAVIVEIGTDREGQIRRLKKKCYCVYARAVNYCTSTALY